MIAAPPKDIAKHLQPWERVDWSPEQLKNLYSDWGTYFQPKQRKDCALKYFDKALEINDSDPNVLIKRSKCRRSIPDTILALQDAQAAADIYKNRAGGYEDAQLNLEICKGLYESNQFEKCKLELHNNIRKFNSSRAKPFEERIPVLKENFKDTLSIKHSAAVEQLIMATAASRIVPTYKKPECDVMSLMEKEEEILSPLERARRKRAFEIYNQTYLNKSWIDVNFLKMLRKNENILLPFCTESTPLLDKLTTASYSRVMRFTKMLHARSPLYNCRSEKYPNKELYRKHHEDNLYRIQYQTCRNMHKILNSIKVLRKLEDLPKLTQFVEEVMGDYVTIKTNRVMPWKFEFMCEVYNQFALALLEPYMKKIDIKNIGTKDRLLKLLHLPTYKGKDHPNTFVFGDKSTYQDSEATDPKTLVHKAFIARMENRLRFAKYPIERAYLLHEIAHAHLSNNAFDACCFVARKAIKEAKECQNKVWQFLILMLEGKSHAVLGKIEQEHVIFKKARHVAEQLKSLELCIFTEVCLRVNAEDWEFKKYTRRPHKSRKNSRNNYFTGSHNSIHSTISGISIRESTV